MTIIGIALSVAMFTAVTEATASAFEYLIEFAKESDGAYHGLYRSVSSEDCEKFESDSRLDETSRLANLGYAKLDGFSDGTYIYLAGMDADQNGLMPVSVYAGRMPENENEVLIPSHLRNKGADLKLGTELELKLGQRVFEGNILGQSDCYEPGEEIYVYETRTVTVVGFYYRFPANFESYDTPGYTVLTIGDESPYDDYLLMFSLKNAKNMRNITEDYSEMGDVFSNKYLLAYLVSGYSETARVVIAAYAAVLIIIILFGSVALIYNSFAISVSERTRQFGLLKSIGATKWQVRDSVIYEALVLCVIGIPLGLISGCIGIGITFKALGSSMGVLFSDTIGVEMKLVVKPSALAAAAVIGLLSTVISAMIPAMRAAKLTPIEAIRQSTDIKISSRQVKSRPLVRKLFGFEGDMASKNFRRNRKRYRAVVISLFSSMVLFIAASSFCSYLTDFVAQDAEFDDYDIIVTLYDDKNDTELNKKYFEQMMTAEHVDSGTLKRSYRTDMDLDRTYVNEKIDPDWQFYTIINFIDDESFKAMCQKYNVDADKYFTGEPMGLFIDSGMDVSTDEDKAEKEYLLTGDVLDAINYGRYKDLPGYTLYTTIQEYDKDINDYVNYYVFAETDYLGVDGAGSYDVPEEHTIRLPEEDAREIAELKIGDVIRDNLGGSDECAIFVPLTYSDEMIGNQGWTNFTFNAEDYKTAESEISDILAELAVPYAGISNRARNQATEKALAEIINVMAYGFIILISLIALVNVFNTISTSIILRRREFAMLRSVGMTEKGFRRMMNYECIMYGVRSVAAGVPVSIVASYLIYRFLVDDKGFTLPWLSLGIAVGSVFAVVFITMLYAMHHIKNDNTIETLRNENI